MLTTEIYDYILHILKSGISSNAQICDNVHTFIHIGRAGCHINILKSNAPSGGFALKYMVHSIQILRQA